jgi:hypothetical protein
MATDQYRALHQFLQHDKTYTSGQHPGSGPEEHNKSTTHTSPIKKKKKKLLLSTMASTLGTHKLRTVFFHFGEWTTYVDHTRETNDTKKTTEKSDRFFGMIGIMKWTNSTQQPNTNEKELCNHIDNRTYLFHLPYNRIKSPNTTNHRNSHNGNGLSSATSSMLPDKNFFFSPYNTNYVYTQRNQH